MSKHVFTSDFWRERAGIPSPDRVAAPMNGVWPLTPSVPRKTSDSGPGSVNTSVSPSQDPTQFMLDLRDGGVQLFPNCVVSTYIGSSPRGLL